jgi:membrane-associated tyrosine/threonine-specific cdc2-inhibitory kinase
LYISLFQNIFIPEAGFFTYFSFKNSDCGPGDSKYMADEILEGHYTKAADIFSLGVTILELATDLDPPSSGPLWHALRENGPDPTLTGHLSVDLRRIIQLMMGRNFHRRPTVDQLLALPAVRKARAARSRQLALQQAVGVVLSMYMRTYILFCTHICSNPS